MERAIELGNLEARSALGLIEIHDSNISRGLSLISFAAKKGHPESLSSLGQFFYTGLPDFPPNKKKALRCFEIAASKNSAKGLHFMGLFHSQGQENVPVDKEKALDCFLKAADGGYLPSYQAILEHPDADKHLKFYCKAKLHQLGWEGPKDTKRALEIFRLLDKELGTSSSVFVYHQNQKTNLHELVQTEIKNEMTLPQTGSSKALE